MLCIPAHEEQRHFGAFTMIEENMDQRKRVIGY